MIWIQRLHGAFKDLPIDGNCETKSIASGIEILRNRIVKELGIKKKFH